MKNLKDIIQESIVKGHISSKPPVNKITLDQFINATEENPLKYKSINIYLNKYYIKKRFNIDPLSNDNINIIKTQINDLISAFGKNLKGFTSIEIDKQYPLIKLTFKDNNLEVGMAIYNFNVNNWVYSNYKYKQTNTDDLKEFVNKIQNGSN